MPAVEMLRKHVDEGHTIRIVTHNDADGVAAGGVLSQVASRLGARFKTSCEKRVDDGMVSSVAAERPPLVIFSDIGGGYLDIIQKHLERSNIIVLDHHYPVEVEADNIFHVNPLLHDLDGARGISGAGVCYLFAKRVDERNLDLSPLGIVGALADRQDKGEKKSFLGLNRLIDADARGAGLLETKLNAALQGRPRVEVLALGRSG